jgi:hypothetical protein
MTEKMNIAEIWQEVNRFFFKWERLNIDINKPFKIRITFLFVHMEIMEWIFFVLFWILSVVGGFVAPIMLFIKGETPIYGIPIVAVFWFGLMWLFFYVWCWFCLGSNFPKRVTVDEKGATIEYAIKFLNTFIPKERLLLSHFKLFGTPILKIKDKKKLKGIWINEYMYRVIDVFM